MSELDGIESFLAIEVAPQAHQLDRDSQILANVLRKMGDRSWLGLKAPTELGGKNWSTETYARLQIALARASGALAFLQTQHQSAVSLLAHSNNSTLKQRFFPQAVTGEKLAGVGFSHLRRQGTPTMQAETTVAGYWLSGTVPWVTGYGLFNYFIVGAILKDGQELYGLVPFASQSQATGGSITINPPLELTAASAATTVSCRVKQWLLSPDYLVTINPPGAIHHRSRRNILNHGFLALGCAYAGVDVLQAMEQRKNLKFLASAGENLAQELAQTERQALDALSNQAMSYVQKLQLRAKMIDLAQRSSLAAVIASSGQANVHNTQASRVYREALLFTVAGQTTDVMQASLQQCLPPSY